MGQADVKTIVIVTVVALLSVAFGVTIGFYGANQFSSDDVVAEGSVRSGPGSASELPGETTEPSTTPTAEATTVDEHRSPTAEPPTPTPRPTETATMTPPPTPPPTDTPTVTTTPRPEPVGVARVTARIALHVRAGPDPGYESVTAARNGEELDVFGQSEGGTWLYVEAPDGTTGWVSRQYTDFAEAAPILPTPTPS